MNYINNFVPFFEQAFKNILLYHITLPATSFDLNQCDSFKRVTQKIGVIKVYKFHLLIVAIAV